jgi:hypothetical protein
MSTESRLVANVKTVVGTIITARGDNKEEFEQALEDAINAIPLITMLENAARQQTPTEAQAVATVAAAFNGTVTSAPAPAVAAPVAPAVPVAVAPVAPPVAPPTAGAPVGGSVPVCGHGQMIGRKGVGAKGEWKGFFCPTPKGTPDQCPPQFVNKKQPEWNLIS